MIMFNYFYIDFVFTEVSRKCILVKNNFSCNWSHFQKSYKKYSLILAIWIDDVR